MESANLGTSSTLMHCKNCGELEDTSKWAPDVSRELDTFRFCFNCNFWWKHSSEPHKGAVVSTMWEHFVVGEEDIPGSSWLRGFGGAKWEILPLDPDQDIVITTNLWHQGSIPMECRKWFTRTAYVRQYTKKG